MKWTEVYGLCTDTEVVKLRARLPLKVWFINVSVDLVLFALTDLGTRSVAVIASLASLPVSACVDAGPHGLLSDLRRRLGVA
jgi:hypothetical protein